MADRTFTFLGTGTSTGVPMIGCQCAVCTSDDPRNHRYRCAALLRLPGGNLLIDTPPELRLQLLRERVGIVHAVLFTHYHADHLMGLDDLRPVGKYLGDAVPLFCTEEVEGRIRTSFSYAFAPGAEGQAPGFVPQLSFERFGERPFEALGERVTPIPLVHAHFECFGFRVGNVAYCTDVNDFPRRSWPLLEGLDVLVIDALRYRSHPGHLSVNEALDWIDRFAPRQAYFTHISHDIDHAELASQLPPNVAPAYDGLSFPF
jgi:phosphoribosyl 1,2-cyclic phosphate phosphodiesterase